MKPTQLAVSEYSRRCSRKVAGMFIGFSLISGASGHLLNAQEELPQPPSEILLGPAAPSLGTPVPPTPTPFTNDSASMLPDDAMDGDIVPMIQGPLHEAFAERFNIEQEEPIVVTKEPPPIIDELPPDSRPDGDNVQWIPGYWGWDLQAEDFIWVSGFWRQIPPNQRWIPGYWTEIGGGWMWVSGFWNAESVQQLLYLPAPPASLEVGPSSPAPNDNSFWIPGCWIYQAGNYRWQPGFWSPGQSDWIWVPARYVWTPSGFIYRSGYWDYAFVDRGLLFAPVGIRSGFRGVYRPSYVIETGPVLLANLYVTPGLNSYYFGNHHSYRGPRSIVPWVSFYQHGFDPLLSYYAYQGRYRNYLRDISQLNRRIASHPEIHSSRTVHDQLQMHSKHHDAHGDYDYMLRVAPVTQLGLSSSTLDFVTPFQLRGGNRPMDNNVANNLRSYHDFANQRKDLEVANNDNDRNRSNWRIEQNAGGSLESGNAIVLKSLKIATTGVGTQRGRVTPNSLSAGDSIRLNSAIQRVTPAGVNNNITNNNQGREQRTRQMESILGSTNEREDAKAPIDINRLRRLPKVDSGNRTSNSNGLIPNNQRLDLNGGRSDSRGQNTQTTQDPSRQNFNPNGGRLDMFPRDNGRGPSGPATLPGAKSQPPSNAPGRGIGLGSGLGSGDGNGLLGGRSGGSILPRNGGNPMGPGNPSGPGTANGGGSDNRGPGRRDGGGLGGLLPGNSGPKGPPPASPPPGDSKNGKSGDNSKRGRRDR